MNNYKIFQLFLMVIIFILFNGVSCTQHDISMKEKEQLLAIRVQQHRDFMKEGKLINAYDLHCPKCKNDWPKEWKKSLQYDQKVDDFKLNYKTESINIEGSLGIVISTMTANFKNYNEHMKVYHYWGFIDNNWYLLDTDRTAPAEQSIINRYYELMSGKALN